MGGEALINIRRLDLQGEFGSAVGEPPLVYPGDQSGVESGKALSCTKGVYWAQQGVGACDDVGTVKFRLSGGEEVTNTTNSITRGYKAGYNVIQTAGIGAVGINAGRGGNGASGGFGGQDGPSGGGGGSGWYDGSVTVVDKRLGGSTGDAKVVLRLQT